MANVLLTKIGMKDRENNDVILFDCYDIIVLMTATEDGGGVCCGRCQKPEEEFWGDDRT